MAERLVINSDAAKHVQAYIEYTNIVGNADGGKVMNEKEYEEFKDKVKDARKNRLYVMWVNSKTGLECKNIGPSSKCFCGHRFKDHSFDNVHNKDVHCQEKKCMCSLFSYVPVYGSNDLKCLCKHSFLDHDPITRKCKIGKCASCKNKFSSTHSCSCGDYYNDHHTTLETRDERVKSGKPVDPSWMQESNMIAGLGGLTNFSSLADGIEREEVAAKSRLTYEHLKAIKGPAEEETKAAGDMDSGLVVSSYKKRQEASGVVSTTTKKSTESSTSAFSLYTTPHTYVRVQIPVKRGAKAIGADPRGASGAGTNDLKNKFSNMYL